MTPLAESESPPRGQITLEDVKKMSDKELERQIALRDGWSDLIRSQFSHGRLAGTKNGERSYCPDYPHDLNAVHKVEGTLEGIDRYNYGVTLAKSVLSEERAFFGEEPDADPRLNGLGFFALANLTARQRCEALVLTLSERGENSICPQVATTDRAMRASSTKV